MEKPLCSLCGKPILDYPRTKSEKRDQNKAANGEKIRGKITHYTCHIED